MIKWRLVIVGLLLLIAAFVYVVAVNLPDPQIRIDGLEKVAPGTAAPAQ